MKASFTIAAFAAFVEAQELRSLQGVESQGKAGHRPLQAGGNAAQQRFNNFQVHFNKHYSTEGEYAERMGRFAEKAKMVDEVNGKAVGPDDLRLELNWFSDLSHEEFMKWTGLDASFAENTPIWAGDNGRRLQTNPASIDHVTLGNMLPVKNQGGCGSCWAFSANSTLEGVFLARGVANVQRFSEQQLVDCTLRQNNYNKSLFDGKDYGLWGCGGGWMDNSWDFQRDQGIMLDSVYPYTSDATGTESLCVHDWGQTIGTRPQTWGKLTQGTTAEQRVELIKAELATRPVAVALDASGVFSSYKSGVLNSGCGTSLNHAVVIVGYSDVGDGGDGGDGGVDPEPPTPLECTVHKWWHTCQETSARRLAETDGGSIPFWRIQNSWGTWWGDNGFIKIGIDKVNRAGHCEMQDWVFLVDI